MKSAVIGASGYVGQNLCKLLGGHKEIEHIIPTSREGGEFYKFDINNDADVEQFLRERPDVVFLALDGLSTTHVEKLKKYTRIIDMTDTYRTNESFTYGVPELFRNEIKKSDRVANPGCYAQSIILAVAPIIKNALYIYASSTSSKTGAGKGSEDNKYDDNIFPYNTDGHRHIKEINTTLSRIAGKDAHFDFMPEAVDVGPGLVSSIFIGLPDYSDNRLRDEYTDFYAAEPFVTVSMNEQTARDVRGTNLCALYVTYNKRTKTAKVRSVIDNLIRGAAGTAVQNMNIMFGLDEKIGLSF